MKTKGQYCNTVGKPRNAVMACACVIVHAIVYLAVKVVFEGKSFVLWNAVRILELGVIQEGRVVGVNCFRQVHVSAKNEI